MMWGGYGFHGPGYVGWFPGMAVMGLVWVAVLVAVIFIVVRAFARRPQYAGGTRNHTPTEGREDSALDILRERYAKGEINQEEYQRVFDDLTQKR